MTDNIPQETAGEAEGLVVCPSCGALPCDQETTPSAFNDKHLASVLTDIACGRGMFGVDPKADLEWAMWEAGKAVGIEANHPTPAAAPTDNKALVEVLRKAHDIMHETTAVLSASDCKKVSDVMAEIRAALASQEKANIRSPVDNLIKQEYKPDVKSHRGWMHPDRCSKRFNE